LFIGNPARQTGWMSERGYKLVFNDADEAICPESKEKYILKNGQVLKAK
jgi:UDP-2-acetamido-3-amino-2,3-dideoxy-glucuronate N-acetyltransferase